MITTTPPVDVISRRGHRAKVIDGLVLTMLGAFAITQPLLSDFRAAAGHFVARRNEPIEIMLLVVVLTVLPGLVANVVVWAADGFSERARATAQTAFVGLFLALIAHTTLVRLTSINWVVLLVFSVLMGAVAVRAYVRSDAFRSFLTYLIPAPLVFALFFLFTPPVLSLVVPSTRAEVDATVGSQIPVVVLVLDEFPVASLLDARGEIDRTRYPNFAALASMSNWYKYTASAHVFTWMAVPSLLSAESPDVSRVPTATDYPGNLFTLLDRSYRLNVVEPYTQLCPVEMCDETETSSFGERFGSLMGDSLRLFTSEVKPTSGSEAFSEFQETNAGRVEQEFATDQADRFDEFLNGISSERSTLNFLHLLLPHAPFRYYPSGRQYYGGGDLAGHESEVWVEPALAAQGYQRHLLQVQAVDRMLGDLLARLESVGILDEALLVVTADHGTSFRPGTPRRDITVDNAYEVGLVPLFIKTPHQVAGVVDEKPARTTDVLPTVADLLGVELPWSHQGRSLVAPREVPPLEVQARSGELVSLDDVGEGLRSATAYLASIFGTDEGLIDLYSFGEFDSLIGSTSAGLAAGPFELTAAVDESWRLIHVAPYTGFVPGFLHGEVTGELGEGTHVAVALNGVVRTIVPIFHDGEDNPRFAALMPDDAFVSGFNNLELFVLAGPPDGPVIRGVNLQEHTSFEMEKATNGRVTRLVDSEGGFWRIEERSPIVGFVDDASWQDFGAGGSQTTDLNLAGWAIDPIDSKPAERVVIFVNDVFAGTAEIDRERADIEDGYESSDVLVSGFVGRLSQFLPTANLEVRAFALSDGLAEELPVTDAALAALAAG